MKNDLLNEPSFQPEPDSEAVEARPIEPQRFMYQCPACNRLKFEILFIQENGVKSMILVCEKGHSSILKNVPELIN